MVLGVNLLLSTAGHMFQMTCSLDDRSSQESMEHHLKEVHSHASTDGHNSPCSSKPDPLSAESVPCSQYAVPCCIIQAVPPVIAVSGFSEFSRTSFTDIAFPRLLSPLYREDFKERVFGSIQLPQSSARPFAADRQAFFGTFLI